MQKKVAFIMLTLLLQQGLAQDKKEVTRQALLWYGYFNTLQFSEKTFLTTELQERHFIQPFAQHQFVTRLHFHYMLRHGWDVAPGMCLFLQNSNDPYNPGIAVPELRPHIEFNQKQKMERLTIDHRYKVEARFYQNTNAERTELEDGFFYSNLRFRYRLQATIPLLKFSNNRALKLRISDEIHLNAGKAIVLTTFDQNRLYAGLNIDFCKSLSAEIGYLNWFQKRPNDNEYFGRNILRFAIFHKINLAKK